MDTDIKKKDTSTDETISWIKILSGSKKCHSKFYLNQFTSTYTEILSSDNWKTYQAFLA